MKRRRAQPRLNLLDRAIASVSPRWGFKRLQFRHALNLFEGGSRSRRTRGWHTPDSSIQADTRRGLSVLRARSRDLAQNNAYAAAAHRELPANVVGDGITPHVNLPDPASRAPGEAVMKEWFDTTACDYYGRLNFYGLESLVMRTVVEAGECLVRRHRRTGPLSEIPLQVQVLEPDHIDTLKDGFGVAGGGMVVQGVEFDAQGRRVAYWIYDHHPGDQHYHMTQIKSSRVPASEILHVFRVDRAGQVRGVPWSAPVILRIRSFEETADARLEQQKVAACFSAFVTPGDPFGQAAVEDEDYELPERLEPGMIEVLGNGKEVTFANPPSVGGFGEYSTITLHEIAAGYGLPYSVLTGDLSRVNFSSGRMGDRAFARNVKQWQQNLMIPQLCQPVERWFMEAAVAARRLAEPVSVRWSPPRRELTDPAREIPALRDAARSGQIPQPELIRQNGYDPDDFLREVQDWNRRMDEMGITFDSDPRKLSGAGLAQPDKDDALRPTTSPEDDDEIDQ
ncbi:MAG: phage portal protein [Wenzhouxiangella sp.]